MSTEYNNFDMSPTAEVEDKFTQLITGYNKATYLGNQTYQLDGKTMFKACFKLDGAKDTAKPEEVFLSKQDGSSHLTNVNMIITAFGGKPLDKDQLPGPILAKCMNKECAILLFPKEVTYKEKATGNRVTKTFKKTSEYGTFLGHPSVLPVSAVGQTIDIAEAPAKPAKKEPKSDDTNPFGGDGF